MTGPRKMLFLSALLLVAVAGWQDAPSAEAGNLTILLPEHEDHADRKRFAKLTIDGKDYTKAKETKRMVTVCQVGQG